MGVPVKTLSNGVWSQVVELSKEGHKHSKNDIIDLPSFLTSSNVDMSVIWWGYQQTLTSIDDMNTVDDVFQLSDSVLSYDFIFLYGGHPQNYSSWLYTDYIPSSDDFTDYIDNGGDTLYLYNYDSPEPINVASVDEGYVGVDNALAIVDKNGNGIPIYAIYGIRIRT